MADSSRPMSLIGILDHLRKQNVRITPAILQEIYSQAQRRGVEIDFDVPGHYTGSNLKKGLDALAGGFKGGLFDLALAAGGYLKDENLSEWALKHGEESAREHYIPDRNYITDAIGAIGSSVPLAGAAIGGAMLAPSTGGASLLPAAGAIGLESAMEQGGAMREILNHKMNQLPPGLTEEERLAAATAMVDETLGETAPVFYKNVIINSLLSGVAGSALRAAGGRTVLGSMTNKLGKIPGAGAAGRAVTRANKFTGAGPGRVIRNMAEEPGQEFLQSIAQQQSVSDVTGNPVDYGQAAYEGLVSLPMAALGLGTEATGTALRGAAKSRLEEKLISAAEAELAKDAKAEIDPLLSEDDVDGFAGINKASTTEDLQGIYDLYKAAYERGELDVTLFNQIATRLRKRHAEIEREQLDAARSEPPPATPVNPEEGPAREQVLAETAAIFNDTASRSRQRRTPPSTRRHAMTVHDGMEILLKEFAEQGGTTLAQIDRIEQRAHEELGSHPSLLNHILLILERARLKVISEVGQKPESGSPHTSPAPAPTGPASENPALPTMADEAVRLAQSRPVESQPENPALPTLTPKMATEEIETGAAEEVAATQETISYGPAEIPMVPRAGEALRAMLARKKPTLKWMMHDLKIGRKKALEIMAALEQAGIVTKPVRGNPRRWTEKGRELLGMDASMAAESIAEYVAVPGEAASESLPRSENAELDAAAAPTPSPAAEVELASASPSDYNNSDRFINDVVLNAAGPDAMIDIFNGMKVTSKKTANKLRNFLKNYWGWDCAVEKARSGRHYRLKKPWFNKGERPTGFLSGTEQGPAETTTRSWREVDPKTGKRTFPADLTRPLGEVEADETATIEPAPFFETEIEKADRLARIKKAHEAKAAATAAAKKETIAEEAERVSNLIQHNPMREKITKPFMRNVWKRFKGANTAQDLEVYYNSVLKYISRQDKILRSGLTTIARGLYARRTRELLAQLAYEKSDVSADERIDLTMTAYENRDDPADMSEPTAGQVSLTGETVLTESEEEEIYKDLVEKTMLAFNMTESAAKKHLAEIDAQVSRITGREIDSKKPSPTKTFVFSTAREMSELLWRDVKSFTSAVELSVLLHVAKTSGVYIEGYTTLGEAQQAMMHMAKKLDGGQIERGHMAPAITTHGSFTVQFKGKDGKTVTLDRYRRNQEKADVLRGEISRGNEVVLTQPPVKKKGWKPLEEGRIYRLGGRTGDIFARVVKVTPRQEFEEVTTTTGEKVRRPKAGVYFEYTIAPLERGDVVDRYPEARVGNFIYYISPMVSPRALIRETKMSGSDRDVLFRVFSGQRFLFADGQRIFGSLSSRIQKMLEIKPTSYAVAGIKALEGQVFNTRTEAHAAAHEAVPEISGDKYSVNPHEVTFDPIAIGYRVFRRWAIENPDGSNTTVVNKGQMSLTLESKQRLEATQTAIEAATNMETLIAIYTAASEHAGPDGWFSLLNMAMVSKMRQFGVFAPTLQQAIRNEAENRARVLGISQYPMIFLPSRRGDVYQRRADTRYNYDLMSANEAHNRNMAAAAEEAANQLLFENGDAMMVESVGHKGWIATEEGVFEIFGRWDELFAAPAEAPLVDGRRTEAQEQGQELIDRVIAEGHRAREDAAFRGTPIWEINYPSISQDTSAEIDMNDPEVLAAQYDEIDKSTLDNNEGAEPDGAGSSDFEAFLESEETAENGCGDTLDLEC